MQQLEQQKIREASCEVENTRLNKLCDETNVSVHFAASLSVSWDSLSQMTPNNIEPKRGSICTGL